MAATYLNKIDIFAAGYIIVELFTLIPLFRGVLEGLQLFEQISVLGNPGKKFFQQLNNVVLKLYQKKI